MNALSRNHNAHPRPATELEPSLLKYIWRNSRNDQIWMLVVILVSMIPYYMTLDLPKSIVNGPIQGNGFENPGATSKFMEIYLPYGDAIFGQPVLLFGGFELDRIGLLFALSFMFIFLVAVNGQFKRYINTFKGRMGERMLRQMRYELFDRVLRYPLRHFRQVKSSEVSSMIVNEVEPMGEFIGDAYTQPLLMGGQAITGFGFIAVQNVYLGILTLVVIGFQAVIIPRMRRRLIALGRERQIKSRELAGRLGEIVDGIQDVHTNDTTNFERATISSRLGKLFFIRFEIYQRKFSIKFFSNMLIQFLAFLFYAVGGYMAIRGSLDIGQLVAVIAAYKDLPGPIRGLLDYDQRRLTAEARYNQVVEQFSVPNLQDPDMQSLPEGEVPHFASGYNLSKVQVLDDSGNRLLDGVTTKIDIGERVVLLSDSSEPLSVFAKTLARVTDISSGKLTIDGKEVDALPEYMAGRLISYVDSNTFFPQGTIYETLTYVLKNHPPELSEEEAKNYEMTKLEIIEAKRTANSLLNAEVDWIDYGKAGVSNQIELDAEIYRILSDLAMQKDIVAFGLRATVNAEENEEFCKGILEARNEFRSSFTELGLENSVETFEYDNYNNFANIGENLLFGTSSDPDYEPENLPSNKMIRKLLASEGLEEPLFAMGKEVAETTVELFSGLSEDNPFFDQLEYLKPQELPEYNEAISRVASTSYKDINEKDKKRFLRLAFTYTESRHRLGLLDDELMDKIVKARKALRQELEELPQNPVNFYDPGAYMSSASVLDNVLLGRISSTMAGAEDAVTEAILRILDELELQSSVFRIGLNFNIGSGGKRMSETQRQKMHVARAILKNPDVLIANQPLSGVDPQSQRRILESILERAKASENGGPAIIWAPTDQSVATLFDRGLMFEGNKITGDDNPGKLLDDSTNKSELAGA
ncbi:ABC transporter transmembrane domain-containing protein [Hoeflea sp. CAU 1731]